MVGIDERLKSFERFLKKRLPRWDNVFFSPDDFSLYSLFHLSSIIKLERMKCEKNELQTNAGFVDVIQALRGIPLLISGFFYRKDDTDSHRSWSIDSIGSIHRPYRCT